MDHALDGIAAVYPPRESIDLDDLAEMISCVVDGAIIMSKTLSDPKRLERQILLFCSFVKRVSASPLTQSLNASPPDPATNGISPCRSRA